MKKAMFGGGYFSPDGQYLAVTGANSIRVQIWNWHQNHLICTLYKGRGTTSLSLTSPVLYSPNARYLVASHQEAELGCMPHVVINVWNAHTGQLLKNIRGSDCSSISFAPDGKELLRVDSSAVGSSGLDILTAYNTRTWNRAWGLTSKRFAPSTVAISPNGKLIALGGHWFGPTKAISQQNEQL